MVLYIENPKDTTRKLLEINEYSKVARYNINARRSLAFLYTKMIKQKEKLRKEYIHHCNKKNKILKSIYLKKQKLYI